MVDQCTTECRTCFVDVSATDIMSLPCCGYEICGVCEPGWFGKAREVDAANKPMNNNNCPNCREPIVTPVENISRLRGHVSAGKAWAHYELGQCYALGQGVPQSDREAFKHFLLAAQGGIVRAAHRVGDRYWLGKGVSQSTDKAIEYYTKGSNARVEACSYYLGRIYAGEGPHQATLSI